MNRTFPPNIYGTLEDAHREILDAARWAKSASFKNVAARLEWAARLVKEKINKDGKRIIEDRGCISDDILHEQVSLAILTATLDEDVPIELRQKIHDSVFKMIDHIFPKPAK